MIESLLKPSDPWLYVACWTDNQFAEYQEQLKSKGVCCRRIDGQECTERFAFFSEMAEAFAFPPYFGRNWAALDECIADLEWLPANGYVLLITSPEHLLADEPPSEFHILVNVLQRAGQEWAEDLSTHPYWPRSAIPFHTVFQCRPEHVAGVTERVLEAGGRLSQSR